MPAKKMMTVEIAAMRSEFQRGYQSIVTSLEEGLQRSGDLCLRRKCCLLYTSRCV